MFFMARGYHSFTVSVRVATTRAEEHARNKQESLGEAVASPDLSYASAGFQPASRPCACDRKGRRRGARCLSRGVPPTRWIWGRSQPWPEPKGFRSTFAPLDARPRGAGRNGRGRRVTTGAVDRLFMHVTRDGRGRVGMGRDPRGGGGATCKIAGIAYTGSNPVPATTALTSNNAVLGRPIRTGSRVGFPSSFPRPTRRRHCPPIPRCWAEHAFDHPGQPGRGLGELVDVDPLGERATVGVTELGGDDAGWFLVGCHG